MTIKPIHIYLVFCGVLALAACKNGNNNTATTEKPAPKAQDTAASAFAPSTPAPTQPDESLSIEERMRQERMAHNRRLYNEALKINDPYTQLEATYNLLLDDTAKTRPYVDTLASLYARLGMADPAMKMADRVLALDPNNKKAMEIKAGGNLGMGKADEAINMDRKLYRQTKDVKYLFAIAELQFDAQDLKGLDNTVKQIEQQPNLAKQKLEMQTDQPGQMQMVPADAVLAYLKGLISLSKNELAMAQVQLHKAVKIYPDFALANRYLQALQNQQQLPQQQH